MKLLSIVVPCYNEEKAAPICYEELCKVVETMQGVASEFLFIDDGSSDTTLKVLRGLHAKDERVRYVSFSRNFGKEAAIYAGLQAAKGDYVVLMDVDLQDPPSLLPEMYAGITQEGFDCVATRRVTRKGEPPIRSFFARMFYKLINSISKTEFVDGARDYRMMTRQMVNSVLSLCEVNRFSKGLFSWVGYKTKWLEYENVERVAGETKWSFWSLVKYSLDGIVGFTTAPLSISSFMGFLFCLIAIVWVICIAVKTLVWGDPVAGWPTLASLILLVGGIQLFSIGILGQYLSKTYLEAKNRPIYITRETESTTENK